MSNYVFPRVSAPEPGDGDLAADLGAQSAAAAHPPDPDPRQAEDEAVSVQSSVPLLKLGYVKFVWLENIDSHQVQILNQICRAISVAQHTRNPFSVPQQ